MATPVDRPAQGEHPAPGGSASGPSSDALRALYDQVVDDLCRDMRPEAEMAFRHACGLAWQRLDVVAIAGRALRGDLTDQDLLDIVRPFVREAIAASGLAAAPVKVKAKRLH